MKRFRLLLTFALVAIGFVAQAQVDFNDPRYAAWGPDAATREANMLKSTFLREALDNKLYNEAAKHFQDLVQSCPEASEAVFARGVVIYKQKIARAKSLDEKKGLVDSLMIVHDLRLQYFASHPKRGRAYILDSKARDYYNYMRTDREGMREVFKSAIAEGGAETDVKLVYLYFQNLCEDYKLDEVMPEEVMTEYERLAPFFENLTGEDAELAENFTSMFSTSGVATCENLESIFAPKIAESPEDVELLSKTVRLMGRMKCDSDFYVSSVEALYKIAPTSSAAISLAAIFQSKNEYDKAAQYLRDALEVEEDMEQREALNARIALIEIAANRIGAAAAAARESINTPDDTKSDNGIAYFVLAQCYAISAGNCEGFDGQATYWAAYDLMAIAIANFTADEAEYKSIAQQILNSYPAYYPSAEECFFREVKEGEPFTINCGIATGAKTTVRIRK